ncbi:MAG: hypothetical protein IIB00_03395 [candidate division Zixibacteria bacterium]|nr:hypothetical protein [candidate division Zixibacteria bacterium]
MDDLIKKLVVDLERTPAIFLDIRTIYANLELLKDKCKILYPLKPLAHPEVLRAIGKYVDGFSVSSLFEARLVKDLFGTEKIIHFTSPCIKESDLREIADYCNHISLNSIKQLKLIGENDTDFCSLGLRINTELSFVKDQRYDPSRLPSKLGIPLSALKGDVVDNLNGIWNVQGILIHSNCESEDFEELDSSIKQLENAIPSLLRRVDWINFGGGYLFDQSSNWSVFDRLVSRLQNKYGLDVYFEPGKGVVGEAGSIVSSVVDIIDNGDKKLAVLDTTVNHMPEVFEFQYRPQIAQESPGGAHSYLLAGASCLAGDVFGEYTFAEPLELGSTVVMYGVGAYNLVKAPTFNGLPLPSIYSLGANGEVTLMKEFTLEEQSSRWGFKASACFGN